MPKKTGSYERLQKLQAALKHMEPVVVAFSGGADSSFLLWACCRVLNPGVLTAVTFASATTPQRELQAAQETAALLAVKHLIYPGPEMQNEDYLANDLLRCYYCKRERFCFLKDQTDIIPGTMIVEGSVTDDLDDYRPGLRAIHEAGISSPLLQAGISKADIAVIAKDHELAFVGRRSESCLATRIKTGQRIEIPILDKINGAESAIHQLGFDLVRVRWQADTVQLEFAPEDLNRAVALRRTISSALRDYGLIMMDSDMLPYQKSGRSNAGNE